MLKEKFSAQRDLKDSLQKERDSHRSEVDQLRKKFEDRMNAEQEKNGQLKVQLAELKAVSLTCTYIHMYVHTYVHTYIHTYVHTLDVEHEFIFTVDTFLH